MLPRIRLIALFFVAVLIGDLLEWLWWLLRHVIAICLTFWLAWLLVGNIAGT